LQLFIDLQILPGDTVITDLLGFRNKCILAGDLNAKHPFWNSAVSNPLGETFFQLFHDFEIFTPQNLTHCSRAVNCDVLDIVVNQIRLSRVIVPDILDSDHLPIVFHILEHVTTKKLSESLEKFTDWEGFQNIASN
jgi:endonuclease/exonuclease/phosphatase family metal-dependent hydrolase